MNGGTTPTSGPRTFSSRSFERWLKALTVRARTGAMAFRLRSLRSPFASRALLVGVSECSMVWVFDGFCVIFAMVYGIYGLFMIMRCARNVFSFCGDGSETWGSDSFVCLQIIQCAQLCEQHATQNRFSLRLPGNEIENFGRSLPQVLADLWLPTSCFCEGANIESFIESIGSASLDRASATPSSSEKVEVSKPKNASGDKAQDLEGQLI